MHVITYLPNFAPPHFAARGIPKNTAHCLHLYVACLPLPDGASSFFLYTKHTLLHCVIFFVKYGKG